MLELLFVFIIILVLAWLAYTYLPHPIGQVVGAILVLLAIFLVLSAVLDGSGRRFNFD